jgi:hypothetical protein
MKFTIMVVDLFIKFRLAAFPRASAPSQVWSLEVLTIEEVASVLETLGFLDAEAAERLSAASTTVTPQLGVNTMRLTDMAALAELFFPEDEPPSAEAQDGYMLVAHGETTEEILAEAGFVVTIDGPLQ